MGENITRYGEKVTEKTNEIEAEYESLYPRVMEGVISHPPPHVSIFQSYEWIPGELTKTSQGLAAGKSTLLSVVLKRAGEVWREKTGSIKQWNVLFNSAL